MRIITLGSRVKKVVGDYKFEGVVVAVFFKLDKTSYRVVVENADGVLHIFSSKQLDFVDAQHDAI